MKHGSLVTLLISLTVVAQTPSFDTQTNILRLPELAELAASPTSLTGRYGNTVTLIVVGGTSPYNVESSNWSVITKLSHEESPTTASTTIKLYITGVTGSCFINVADAAGNLIVVPVSVH